MTASNPFCTRFVRPGVIRFHFDHDCLDPESIPTGSETNRPEIDRIIRQLIRCRLGLIVGPHGSGKTTLLHTLQPQLNQHFGNVINVTLHACGTRRLADQVRHARRSAAIVAAHQRDLPEDGLLIVDGLEQLTRLSRAGMLARAHKQCHYILATSHGPALGFATLLETKISIPLVRSLTRSLILQVQPDVRRLIDTELGRRDLSSLTNLRDLWFEFYDLVAAMDAQLRSPQWPSTPIAKDS